MIQVLAAAAVWISLAIYRSLNHLDTHRSSAASGDFIWPFDQIRESFSSSLVGVTNDSSALVAGLAIGDDSSLSQSLAQDMQAVGITHLTAVSGANCAIVIAIVYLLLKRLRMNRSMRTLIAMAALVAYVLLVGPEPSVMRSSFMAAAVLVVVAMGRATASLSALSFAVIVLLVISPEMATNFGFGLSVFATAGILVLAPELHRRLSIKLPLWLAMPLAVSISAQIACWPILLALSGGVQTYSILANLLVEPLVAPITVLGLLACLVAWPLPWLASALNFVASVFSWPITFVAGWLAHLPMANLQWPEGILGIVLAATVTVAVVLAVKFKSHRVKSLSSAFLVLVLAVFTGSNASDIVRSQNWMAGDWQIVACDVGQGDALVIRSAGAIALIDAGREPDQVNDCLSDLKVSRIDLLVLTHFDQDHVGGLSGAIRDREIQNVLVTDFHDDRPDVKITTDELRSHQLQPIRAYRGLSGSLGETTWKVLSPHQQASEAEDSNDGSVTMLFESPNFRLISLADLGERGQMRLAQEMGDWSISQKPLVMKVSHHGSADQYAEFLESLRPELALISVGKGNSYGHPTFRTLSLLRRINSKIVRTDEFGSIALSFDTRGESGAPESGTTMHIRASG